MRSKLTVLLEMTPLYKQVNRLLNTLYLTISVLFVACLAYAGGLADHPVQSGIVTGAPLGSYALSGIDNVNLYNGNLNIRIPLLHVGGRGEAGYTMMFNRNRIHAVSEIDLGDWFPPQNRYLFVVGDISSVLLRRVGYGPGIMYGKLHKAAGPPNSCKKLTLFTFILPDGTKIELRDQLYDGQPKITSTTGTTSRGQVFASKDGSSITFVSDAVVVDPDCYQTTDPFYPSGTLLLNNGLKYRIDDGSVTSITDRNGNKTQFTYDANKRVTAITDSLNRVIQVEYQINLSPYGTCDRITYSGFNNEPRYIHVSYDNLGNVLYPGETLKSAQELFPEIPGQPSEIQNLPKPAAIWLPNNSSYSFQYNSYGEVAKITLPTGGSYEYTYPSNSGVVTQNDKYQIFRPIVEKRVYPDLNELESKVVYTISNDGVANSVTTETSYDGANEPISKTNHYHYGNALKSLFAPWTASAVDYAKWREGREYNTIAYDPVTSAILKETYRDWQQASPSWWTGDATIAPSNNPHVAEIRTTLESTLVSKRTFAYDSFNNPTDVYEYDFGNGTSGQFLRRSHTDYINDANYTSHTGAHLRNLPLQAWISSDATGANKVSLSLYEYDNYSTDQNHGALLSRQNIVGHDIVNFGTANVKRGNVTAATSYANAQSQTDSISVYAQYDILGNVVKSIDAKGYVSTISYSDNFGSPDNEARSNSAPPQLNGQSTFAFATATTNSLGWTAYTQHDFFIGQPVNVEDVNGLVSKMSYDDPLDRPKQTGDAVGTALASQSTIVYDDENKRIEFMRDLNALNDNLLKSESYYDGLGRTIETRRYESNGGFIASRSVPFDTIRDPESSDWRVATKISNPFRPNSGEQPVWTTKLVDALGRPTKIITHDGALVKTQYIGNTVTITDQAGRKTRSTVNALGWITRVDETNEEGQLDVNGLPAQPTNYNYDALNNLIGVQQNGTTQQQCSGASSCSQTRTFEFDSLSRLKLVINPESGTTQFQYDKNGNLIKRTDGRGVITDFVYDSLNRITNKNYSAPGAVPPNYLPSPNVSYTYDDANVPNSKGRLTQVSNGFSTTDYAQYDIRDRVKQSRQTIDGVSYGTAVAPMTYSYNLSGVLTEQSYPSGRVVKYSLDTDGDLMQIMSKSGSDLFKNYANAFSFNSAGAVSSLRLGNGKWESTQFNSRLQPVQVGLGASASDAGLLKLNYDYGSISNNGNVLSQTITVPTRGTAAGFVATQTYTYDSVNRIKQAIETVAGQTPPTWKQTFDYDRYGNRTFDADNTTTLPQNCPEVVCNPSSSSSTNRLDGYEFDSAGNTTIDSMGRKFVYDSENRQVEVKSQTNQVIAQYAYDGNGKRVRKFVPTSGSDPADTTHFVYDASGKLVAEYSNIIASLQDARVNYLTQDHLNSPRIVTDDYGAVVARRDFLPFGEEIARQAYGSDAVRQKFTGYERDSETTLDYAKARMFGSSIGRFTSPDPTLASSVRTNPQSWNRYSYVMNNPYRYVDPSGMVWGVRMLKNGDMALCYAPGTQVCAGYTALKGDVVVHNYRVLKNGKWIDMGTVILREDSGKPEPAVPIDIQGKRQVWLSEKDAEVINDITGGALCSLSAGFVCPNAGNPTADNLAAAGDVIQSIFLIKSLLRLGLSKAAIKGILKSNPDDVAEIAEAVTKNFGNLQCVGCADALEAAYKLKGVSGEVLELRSTTGYIVSETAGVAQPIASNGIHQAVKVGDTVFDNIHKTGRPYAEWIKDFSSAGDITVSPIRKF